MKHSAFNKDFEHYLSKFGEVGYADLIMYPIVQVNGLPSAKRGEVVMFEDGSLGQILSLGKRLVEVLLFSVLPVASGSRVARTGSDMVFPVGEKLLGRIIDSLGNTLIPGTPIEFEEYNPVNKHALGINRRAKVTETLETGVSVVDLTVPLGRGQRELVIGDRKTGKTNFLLQTILTQVKMNTICVYAAIGKNKTEIHKIEEFLKEAGIINSVCIVATSSTDSAGSIFQTPYAAMTLSEYFRDKGKDVLLIFDDLSTHAKYYREVSLIGSNFPGRNSYPGDIFYTHSRLFERAGNFSLENGKTSSITCLAAAETTEGDISGYIQTNLMSMTDGHIFFDKDLFDQGRRPSVNYFLSVTRVGRQTQTKVRSGISRELSNFLGLYEKTQGFVHFGAELGEGARSTLAMGDRILDFFNQQSSKVLPLNLQVMMFCLIWVGVWTKLSIEEMRVDLTKVILSYEKRKEFKEYVDQIVDNATDFNAMLGQVSTESSKILALAEVAKIKKEKKVEKVEKVAKAVK